MTGGELPPKIDICFSDIPSQNRPTSLEYPPACLLMKKRCCREESLKSKFVKNKKVLTYVDRESNESYDVTFVYFNESILKMLISNFSTVRK